MPMKKVAATTFAVFILSACATSQTAPAARATLATRVDDCFNRLPYTLLRTGSPMSDVLLEVSQSLRLTGETEPDERIIATAEKLSAALQAAERELDEGKTRIGDCYGKGIYGERAAKTYEDTASLIVTLRQEMLKRKQG